MTTASSQFADPNAYSVPHEERLPAGAPGSGAANRVAAGSSVNAYADRLMDDLFQDMDQILQRDSAPALPAAESASNAYPQSRRGDMARSMAGSASPTQPTSVQVVLSPVAAAMPSGQSPGALSYEQSTQDPNMDALVALMPTADPAQPSLIRGSYDRLMLGVGCISVVISMALWLLYQEAHRPRPVATAPTESIAAAPDNNQFADYVQKTLNRIDQQSAQNPASAGTAPSVTMINPSGPTVVIPSNTTPGAPTFSPRISVGLERIYAPTYQFPRGSGAPTVLIAPLPKMPKTNQANPSLPNSLANGAGQAGAIASNSATVVERRLAGVLDQGNHSVALFEVNGLTRRYEIGESIGSSGWMLVEVSKDQAVIRRNGEVRSILVGQSF
jgi:hypothetical protein